MTRFESLKQRAYLRARTCVVSDYKNYDGYNASSLMDFWMEEWDRLSRANSIQEMRGMAEYLSEYLDDIVVGYIKDEDSEFLNELMAI